MHVRHFQDFSKGRVIFQDTKRKIREICGLSNTHFQVIMTKLKKNKIIDNGKINPKFIPRVEHDSKGFQLLLAFDLQ